MKFALLKILKSLSKYPLPIISGIWLNKASQALILEGVGDKTAATIAKLLKK